MNRTSTKYLVIHVTATPPSWKGGLAEVTEMHKRLGWSRCGYRYIIRRDGEIEAAPGGDKIVSNHVRGFNSVALGISLVGGVNAAGQPDNNATPAQMSSLERLLRHLVKKYPNAGICGHRDLSPDRDGDGIIEPHEYLKACPCFDVIPWARSKGLPAADIRGTWDAGTVEAPKPPDARIVYLQKLLAMAGYEFGAVDGYAGPKTKKALERFQAAQRLPQTGAFDRATVDRLRDMFEANRPPAKVVRVPAVDTLIAEVEESNPLGSKSNVMTALAGAGGVMASVKQAVVDAQDMVQAAPWICIALLIIAGVGYAWWSRNRKSRLAKEARRAQAVAVAGPVHSGFWPDIDNF